MLLRYGDDTLEVEVLDDGRGPDPAAGPSRQSGAGGHGLLGMRERAALHDGRLEAGARPGGGYRVRARIPLDRPDRAALDNEDCVRLDALIPAANAGSDVHDSDSGMDTGVVDQ